MTAACAEFPWQGTDDGDEAYGRGWLELATASRLVGYIFIHQGDDSGFICDATEFSNGLLGRTYWCMS